MAVEIVLSTSDQNAPVVLEAFDKYADMKIELAVHDDNEGYHANWEVTYPPRQDGETAKAYATRVIKEFPVAIVKMWAYAEDRARYATEVSAITPPAENVPDDIVEGM